MINRKIVTFAKKIPRKIKWSSKSCIPSSNVGKYIAKVTKYRQ